MTDAKIVVLGSQGIWRSFFHSLSCATVKLRLCSFIFFDDSACWRRSALVREMFVCKGEPATYARLYLETISRVRKLLALVHMHV